MGFQNKWIRTDYQFESLEEAIELAGFFFGEELADQVRERRVVLSCLNVQACGGRKLSKTLLGVYFNRDQWFGAAGALAIVFLHNSLVIG